jgi:hypothetical protein
VFEWLRKRLSPPSPLERWTVEVKNGALVTTDGERSGRALPIRDLRKVVVATDDSGPWGADVVFLLYADSPEAAAAFPLEAQGCGEFVAWLSSLPGYRDCELARAMASTDVAEFLVYEADR